MNSNRTADPVVERIKRLYAERNAALSDRATMCHNFMAVLEALEKVMACFNSSEWEDEPVMAEAFKLANRVIAQAYGCDPKERLEDLKKRMDELVGHVYVDLQEKLPDEEDEDLIETVRKRLNDGALPVSEKVMCRCGHTEMQGASPKTWWVAEKGIWHSFKRCGPPNPKCTCSGVRGKWEHSAKCPARAQKGIR